MPFYDEATRTITLRVVYDGLGTAGKTTNVQQLHALYTVHRSGPVVAPEVTHGRTAYFDWLELSTGTLDGKYTLRCQVLTVPGQFAYAPRRWKLLSEPDAIVCVCDSTPQGLHRGRLGLEFLRELRTRGVCPNVPVVVQANKRDLPEAVSLERFREELSLGASEPLVEAVASTGDGVRLTFMTALDLARWHVRGMIREGGIGSLTPKTQTPDELLAFLKLELEDAEDEAYAVADAIASADRTR